MKNQRNCENNKHEMKQKQNKLKKLSTKYFLMQKTRFEYFKSSNKIIKITTIKIKKLTKIV